MKKEKRNKNKKILNIPHERIRAAAELQNH